MRRAQVRVISSVFLKAEPEKEDDYGFTIGGERYYVDRRFKEENEFLIFTVIEELEQERKKNAALESKLAALKKVFSKVFNQI